MLSQSKKIFILYSKTSLPIDPYVDFENPFNQLHSTVWWYEQEHMIEEREGNENGIDQYFVGSKHCTDCPNSVRRILRVKC